MFNGAGHAGIWGAPPHAIHADVSGAAIETTSAAEWAPPSV